MSGAELYDEFGNYVGPEEDSHSDASLSEEDVEGAAGLRAGARGDAASRVSGGDAARDQWAAASVAESRADGLGVSAIVLHEDKRYYPDADEVYGRGVEVVVADADGQDVSEPLVKPQSVRAFSRLSASVPELRCSLAFLGLLASKPALQRCVAVVGSLHHGKTVLLDLLIEATLAAGATLGAGAGAVPVRYTDSREDEQARRVSIKSCPTSLALEDGRGKTMLLHLVDCPGHPVFSDEADFALRACDGALLVVDAVEGVALQTERMVRLCARHGVRVSLVVAKVDRLIHELKLPPNDAYHKLASVVERVNQLLREAGLRAVSPLDGSVVFAGAEHGWSLSLLSFARLCCARHKALRGVQPERLAAKLWGNFFFDPDTRKFARKPSPAARGQSRAFVQFVLEPLYKLYAQVLGEEPAALAATLAQVGVALRPDQLRLDARPLLRIALRAFFAEEATRGLVDAVVQHVPAPGQEQGGADREDRDSSSSSSSSTSRVAALFAEPQQHEAALRAAQRADASGPLLASVCKLYSSPDAKSFSALVRVWSGTLRVGERVAALGPGWSAAEPEDAAEATVMGLALCGARWRVGVDAAAAGSWALVEGLDAAVAKSATLCRAAGPLVALRHPSPLDAEEPCLKLAVEPLRPAELPKMLHGLRCVSRSYPYLRTKVEESGEHVLLGTGELYLDCVMHDLREMYAGVEVKVSDPLVALRETVVESSSVKMHADTPNGRNRIAMLAEPLDKQLARAIETGKLPPHGAAAADALSRDFGWDRLAARSLWAFGPDERGPNALLDDTVGATPEQRQLLGQVKGSIVQGFRWAAREGPLCDEPLRGVKFRVLDATVAQEAVHRGAGFLIPAARRVAYSSFLAATPRVMEPVLLFEATAPGEHAKALTTLLRRRRGHVTSDVPIGGTPLTAFRGYIPAIDALGFETDLRLMTQGQAMLLQVFDHWAVAPGDPLDPTVVLRPLEPCSERELARELMVKTRRRKGLSEDVALSKFVDDPDLLRRIAALAAPQAP